MCLVHTCICSGFRINRSQQTVQNKIPAQLQCTCMYMNIHYMFMTIHTMYLSAYLQNDTPSFSLHCSGRSVHVQCTCIYMYMCVNYTCVQLTAVGAAEASSMKHFPQSQTPRILSNHCLATLVTVA